MTQEEKAKAYDKVSKEVKDFFEGRQKMYSNVEQTLKYLFPELCESEDDRIRKELITHCKNIRCVTEEGAEGIAKWIAWLEKQGEQKPAWSEEDETVLDNLIYALANDRIGNDRDEYVDWLKALKGRVQPQPKQEWSEEDESRITTICTYLQDYARLSGSESRTIRINEYCDWLKSLKQRIGG